MDEARRKRTKLRLIEDVVIGMVIIVAGGLCALTLGVVALFAGDETLGWLIAAAAAAFGIYVFLIGISFVRGSPSFGGIARFGTIGLVVALLLVAGLVQARNDRAVGPVSRAVEHQYMKRGKFTGVNADCSHIHGNADGSEYWVCDVAIDRPSDLDTCNINLRRFQAGNIRVRITYCINDDL